MAIVLTLTSCGKKKPYQELTIGALRNMRSFTARVDALVSIPYVGRTNFEISIILDVADNERYGIYEEYGTTNLAEFAKTLEEGNKYEFPKVLLEFEAANGKVER